MFLKFSRVADHEYKSKINLHIITKADIGLKVLNFSISRTDRALTGAIMTESVLSTNSLKAI